MAIAVVVGGGFSGVVATRELLRVGWQVIMVEPQASPGRGLAYSTSMPWHLLNSRVSGMSVDPDQPADFLAWCQARDPGIGPDDFVSRGWYGDYLTEALRASDQEYPGALTIHRGRVARIFESSRGTLAVLLADDVVIPADRVVLAVGNPPPAPPSLVDRQVRRSDAYVGDPWQPGALEALTQRHVLLIGTGLTAVDVALTLARSGRHERITAVSRHGLLPRRHLAAHGSYQLRPGEPGVLTLRQALRWMRRQASRHDWRDVMDALRPQWNRLWRQLSTVDRERFLRHVSRYWEVHRHRMAPVVAQAVDGLLADGRLTVRPAELCGMSVDDHGLRAVLCERDGSITVEPDVAVVNCTGPGRIIEVDPLVRSLIADGLAQPGPYRLGLATDEYGGLIGRGHRPTAIFTLGPPRRGDLWETTAAPEIRAQARDLADHLAASTGSSALGSRCADSAYPLPGGAVHAP